MGLLEYVVACLAVVVGAFGTTLLVLAALDRLGALLKRPHGRNLK